MILLVSYLSIPINKDSNGSTTQLQSSIYYDLYKIKYYSISLLSTINNYYTAGGLWFMYSDTLHYLIFKTSPVNSTYYKLDYEFNAGDYPLYRYYNINLYAPYNIIGRSLVVSVFPYGSYVTPDTYNKNVYSFYIAYQNVLNDNSTDIRVFSGSVAHFFNGRRWVFGSTTGAQGSLMILNSSVYTPDIISSTLNRTVYFVPPTVIKGMLFNNGIPMTMAIDNVMVINPKISTTYGTSYSFVVLTGLPYSYVYPPYFATPIKYVDSSGNQVVDYVGQKIPILYLQSPLSTVSYRHLDLVVINLYYNGTFDLHNIGIFFYNTNDTTAGSNNLTAIYDIPGVSPNYKCSKIRYGILPSKLDPYSTKAYLLTDKVEMISWVDTAAGVVRYALKSPVVIALYDQKNRLYVELTINNITMSVKDVLDATSICHYNIDSASFNVSKVYDLSSIMPNDNAAMITMFDTFSPRAKYYGDIFFRLGYYDSVAGFNPTKVVVFRKTSSGFERYVIEGKISPISATYKSGVVPESMIHTWYGSPILASVQTSSSRSSTNVIYEYFIPVPVQNITALPKSFNYTITYTYTVTPISITYLQRPGDPNTLNNVLALINITDPNILSKIATPDARDIRFFEDNTRGAEYWRDSGLTYGILEYIPGQRLVVLVLLPSIYANTTKVIYMYSGFPYASPVAQSADNLLATYPVLKKL